MPQFVVSRHSPVVNRVIDILKVELNSLKMVRATDQDNILGSQFVQDLDCILGIFFGVSTLLLYCNQTFGYTGLNS